MHHIVQETVELLQEVPEDMARTEDYYRRSLNDCLRVFFGGVRRKKTPCHKWTRHWILVHTAQSVLKLIQILITLYLWTVEQLVERWYSRLSTTKVGSFNPRWGPSHPHPLRQLVRELAVRVEAWGAVASPTIEDVFWTCAATSGCSFFIDFFRFFWYIP